MGKSHKQFRVRIVRLAPLQSKLLKYASQPVKEQTMETPSKRAAPKTLLRLEHKEYFQLYKWLEKNIPQLEPGITRTQVAVLASADLGFDMNENHIKSALNTIGLDLPGTANPRALEEKIAVLVRTLRILWRHAYPECEMPTEFKDLL